MAQQTQMHGTAEDCVELTKDKLFYQIPTSSRFSNADNLSCGGLPEIPKSVVHQDGKPLASFVESFGILKNVGTQLGLWNDESVNGRRSNGRRIDLVSTNELIRMAGENIIQASSSGIDHITELIHPYHTSISGLSDEGRRDVAVIQQLLASAEKVGQQKFDYARILLDQCEEYSSKSGNPIQRLVYYFSAALRLKISLATEVITPHDLVKMKTMEMKDTAATQNSAFVALHLKVPFCQVSQFTATNVIIEDVVHSKNIHIIELAVRDGLQCTIIMQALADRLTCPVEHLKVTAVGTTSLKNKIQETGEQLTSFAKSMNLSFSFNVVVIDDMLNLNKGLFELDDDETVAVYSSCFLNTMIERKDRLECLMKVLISLKPCVMVVSEIEANHNSPVFVNRFIEALFYCGAFFDCMADCMSNDKEYRNFLEYAYFGPSIHNIVDAEGEERTIRHVKANVWSQFFARFRVVQKELSMTSLYQATLVSKKFSCGSSCSLYMDGKSLIIGWKERSNMKRQPPRRVKLEYDELPDVQNYMSENVKSQSELFQNNRIQQEEQVEPFLAYGRSDELCCGMSPSPCQLDEEERTRLRNIHYEISELASLEEKKSSASGLSSFGILNFTTKFWQHNPVKPNHAPSSDNVFPEGDDRSVNKIIRLAGEKFIRSSSLSVDDHLEHSDPSSITLLCQLYDEETRDVEVIKHLLASAEKVGEQQFDSARELLSQCNEYSSDKGSAAQRLVYYFSATLQERIDREMGIKISDVNKSPVLQEPVINRNTICLALFQQLPFCRVVQFTAMQAIIENLAEAKKIHIIDLDIKDGTHFSIVIQALAIRYTCPVEHLKITALGTKSLGQIEDAGKRLINFAKSMNLSLSFNVVMVADMLDINENLFDLDTDEVAAVYLPFVLSTMIAQQDRFECLMRVLRNINPCVMVE